MKNLKGFGTIVQERRMSKNITRQQLADVLAVSEKVIENIENGEHSIDIDEAFDLKRALDIPLSSLMELYDKNDKDILTKLKIIEYCDELGTDQVLEIIKSFSNKKAAKELSEK